MVDLVFENAKKMRALTPYSFRMFFDKMEIFKPFGKSHKEMYENYKPESFICLPILPSEIFYITYNNFFRCPDENCDNFIDLNELEEYNEFNTKEDVKIKNACENNITFSNFIPDYFSEKKNSKKN